MIGLAPGDDEVVHLESITALPEGGGWKGNKKVNLRAVFHWLSGCQHARNRSLAPSISGYKVGCHEVEEARRVQLTTAIRWLRDVSGSCKGPMVSCSWRPANCSRL